MTTHPQPDISFINGDWDSIPGAHRFSHNAMATVFEIIIIHEDVRYAQQAAWAAFDELDKLEQQLSRFIENSDISRINNLAANQPLQVGLETFECLRLCVSLGDLTGGAFDVTVGSGCSMQESKIKLDESQHTVELLAGPVQIDLGGIGKGYAVDRMAALLADWSIDNALINGGYSSVLTLGKKNWHLTLSNPANPKEILAHLYLQDRSVSGSGLLKGAHIIDPRTAKPVKDKMAAWACTPTAVIADALSTAFMVMSPEQIEKYCLSHPDTLAMVVTEDREGKKKILRYGLWE